MKKSGKSTLYIDPFSGISGDMLLGAFLALGVPMDVIARAVESVIPGEVDLKEVSVTRSGLAGTACEVKIAGGPGRRTLDEMLELVRRSGLPERVVGKSCKILESLGDAEAIAHGKPDGLVHLHELGGQDTLADIVGSAAAVDYLDPDKIRSGPVNLGRGFVQTDHGRMPVPAPATAYLVEGMPVFSDGPEGELTTPTGAAILRSIADDFGAIFPLTVRRTGCGAGSRDFHGFPNLLRMFLGESAETDITPGSVMIECGVDDVSPEYLSPVIETLQTAGALEVHLIQALTKKGRLGVLIRVLAPHDLKQGLMDALLESTGSAGLRYQNAGRVVLSREMLDVKTPYGEVSFKRWRTPSGKWRFKPEFEDIRRLADQEGITASSMRDVAVAAYLAEVGDGQEED